MKTISQVSIFIENTKGRLAKVCGLFGDNNINIKALTIAETPEFGILRVVLNDTEKEILESKYPGISKTNALEPIKQTQLEDYLNLE